MSKRKPRRQHAADLKATVLRRHYVDKVAISALCEEYDLQPSLVHYWQQQFWANAGAAFEAPGSSRECELEKKLATAEEAVTKKDSVIAWVTEEHVRLKKVTWGHLNGKWVAPDLRDNVIDFIRDWAEKTEIPQEKFIAWITHSKARIIR